MVIYLIGYEKIKTEDFINLLKEKNIKYLVDVRENPFSMRKDFIKKYLKEKLEKEGIKYIHIKELGNPREIRKEYKEKKDLKLALFRYMEYIKEGLTKEIEDEIKELLRKGNTALMCYEKNPLECHRLVLAYELYKRGVINEFIDIRAPVQQDKMMLYCEDLSNIIVGGDILNGKRAQKIFW